MSLNLLLLVLLIALAGLIWALTRPDRQGEFTLRVGKNLLGIHLRLDRSPERQGSPPGRGLNDGLASGPPPPDAAD